LPINIICSDTLCIHGKCKKEINKISTQCICDLGWKGDYCDKMIFNQNNDSDRDESSILKVNYNNNSNNNENNISCTKSCHNDGVCKFINDKQVCECSNDTFEGEFCQIKVNCKI
jgi:hypothetical protein